MSYIVGEPFRNEFNADKSPEAFRSDARYVLDVAGEINIQNVLYGINYAVAARRTLKRRRVLRRNWKECECRSCGVGAGASPCLHRQSPTAVRAMRSHTPRPHRGHLPQPPPCIMKAVMLLVAWAACSAGEPLSAALQRRSSRPGVYADTFSRGYRPFAFVAVPLHAPVPVLHVLYPAPAPPSRARPPAGNAAASPLAAQPSQLAPVYAAAMPHGWFAPALKLPPAPTPAAPPPQETALEVLYARPTAQGGYEYSRRRTRRPAGSRPRRPPPPRPLLIRVHKYRVVRDR
ncbi:atherin-like [Hyposmocoma kahamanoa]|uniref:atherin-like n=1 Tax=Hyposmocoma kahamanoa TaxID=1477025 RepID=UPI000E6D74CA|nr:atherin-like [Hyposmocoma kahamanoa]